MSNNQTVDLARLAEAFGALSNPHRLSVFQRLMACCGPSRCCSPAVDAQACVGALGQDLGIAPSTVSHHIKELRHAGLIHLRRIGRNVECWVNPDAIRELAEFLGPPPPSDAEPTKGEE
jgi:ArsR family transcriptional regulator